MTPIRTLLCPDNFAGTVARGYQILVFFPNHWLYIGLMESRHVRHFLAAYDVGTFAGAAEQLRLSQQAISKSISRLESQLGVRLFERDGRRVRPTSYAELFLPHARTIAAESDRFRADLDDMLGGRAGQLRIGVGPSPAAGLLADAIHGLDQARDVRFSIAAGVYEKMIDDLIRGRLDLLVALRQVDRNDPLVREEVLGDVAYVVVAGASHRLALRKRIALAEIAAERWLAGTNIGAVERAYLASFAAAGAPLARPEIETTSVLFAHATLDHGTHLAILPELMVRREVRGGRLVILDVDAEPWTRPLVVATRVRAPITPLVSSLVDRLRRSAAQAGG
jgi:DNA-binding transcriptional LysR family regulator